MTADVKIVRLTLKNGVALKIFEEAIKRADNFEVINPQSPRRPDLWVHELSSDHENDFKRIQSIVQSDKAGEIFLTSEKADPNLIMKAMRAGVKEYFPQPVDPVEVRAALERFQQRSDQAHQKTLPKQGRIISVVGSKGGVGATTIAVNLSVALAEKKSKPSVALLDMNSYFGEIPLFLEMKPKYHWGEITKHIDRLDASLLMNVLSKHETGIHVLPSPAYLNGHVDPTPAIMDKLLRMMKTMFDFIIIDGGQSLNQAALKVIELSDQLMLITISSLPCLSNTNKLKKSLGDYNFIKKDRIKVILNRYMKKNEISLKDAEKGIDQKMFWVIPNDYRTTMAAINNGKPLANIAPRSAIAKIFAELADELAPEEALSEKKRWGLFAR